MTHRPIRVDADPLWDAIHRAAERQESALRRLFLAAFASLAERAALIRFRTALQFGNVEQALQAVPVADLLRLRPAVEEILRQVANTGATIGLEADLVVRLGTNAGLPVFEIASWARQRSAGLVTSVTEQTRLALRDAIVAAIQAGASPAKLAKQIEPMIGLNRRQIAAWLERPTKRYAEQLIRQRARVIARHELIQAANEGRRLVWERDVAAGLIAPDRWEREWVAIVPTDGRTCPICEELDGQRAPINGAYPDGTVGPPAHVLCRCTEVLRRVA